MKILLFGSRGQIGYELSRLLSTFGEIIALDRQNIDLADLERLHTLLCDLVPDIIVNAAAYTAVDKAEAEPLLSQKINVEAVRIMAHHSRDRQACLIHYSTDYVFDGKKEGMYLESDAVNPLSVYGKTKRVAEKVIQNAGCNHLIFRTSWVYSAHGNNFIKTILRLAEDREELNVVADQIGTPTSAEMIADMTVKAMHAWQAGTLPNGLYHLTASGEVSWYELACYVVEGAVLRGKKLKAQEIHAIATEEYPLPAQRPKNSRLDSSKLAGLLSVQIPDWRHHVERVLDQLILLQGSKA